MAFVPATSLTVRPPSKSNVTSYTFSPVASAGGPSLTRRQVLTAGAAAAIATVANKVYAATTTEQDSLQSLYDSVKSLREKYQKNNQMDLGREFGNSIGIDKVTLVLDKAKSKVSKGGSLVKDKTEKIVTQVIDSASEIATASAAGGVGMTKPKQERAQELLDQMENGLQQLLSN